MAKIFAVLIKDKRITIDSVPEKDKKVVLDILKKDGLDGYGNPLQA